MPRSSVQAETCSYSAPGDSGGELGRWGEAVWGAGAGRVASRQGASAGGSGKKSSCRSEVVVAPVLTKNDKPWGSLAEAFAVGERLLQGEK